MKFLRLIPLLFFYVSFLSSCAVSSTPTFRISVSQCSSDEWRVKMNNEMLLEALFYPGLEVEIRSAGDDNERQVKDIEDFVKSGTDMLIVAPNEAAPISPAVEAACRAGIPVIIVDRKILSDEYTAFIGADNYQIGKSIGLYVARLLSRGGNVVELTGLIGSSPAQERHDGFNDAIASNPNVNLMCSTDAGWEKDRAYDQMLDVLSSYDGIDVVFAHNDRMAYGAYLAAKSVGMEQSMTFIGIDALSGKEGGVTLVLNGILDATFIYPTGGDKVIQLAMQILGGKDFSRQTVLNTAIVDRSNAQLMALQEHHIEEQQSKLNAINSRFSALMGSYSRQKSLLYTAVAVIAFALCLLILLLILLKQRSTFTSQLQIQRDRLIQLSNQLEDATQAKLNFFTNVSHEFKTPLTLINDPLNQVIQSQGLDENQKYLINTAKENVGVLKNLVSQILDFRKYEGGKQKLLLSRMNLQKCMVEWNNYFRPSFNAKHIKFRFVPSKDVDSDMAGDIYKIERIYFNLLSNALKFTPENGVVEVRLGREEDSLTVEVHNSGSYIPAEQLNNIFTRFYTSDYINAGTGIGLTLAQAFAEMHGGTITVSSDIKSGTSFIVVLPVGNVMAVEDIQVSNIIGGPVSDNPSVQEIEDEVINNEFRQSILIIDDNESIRQYLNRLLRDNFYVIEASNGLDGVKKALQYIPNLIISDVMMPGIDGFECCRRIKKEVQTCHIPIILLTAYSMEENHIDAYEAGADSYISKPFSSDVLMARIRNLLDSRVRIKTGSDDILTLQDQSVEDMDREFMSRFKTVIDKNISNSELTVDEISEMLGMSRVQLYRKTKMLTNYSPNEYLRMRRLKKAQKLLLTTELTIAEVCYETGFNTPSYFTKCFREYYNELPSDYVKRMNSK